MSEHVCHAIGCDVPVHPRRLMCPPHWRMVPKNIQRLIWLYYVPGQEVSKTPTVRYLETARVAIECVRRREASKK